MSKHCSYTAENWKGGDSCKMFKVGSAGSVAGGWADVIWPYQGNTAKCSQEMLGQSPGDGAAEADMAPGLPLQGTHSPALHCLFETKHRAATRGSRHGTDHKGQTFYLQQENGSDEKMGWIEWTYKWREVRKTTDFRSCGTFVWQNIVSNGHVFHRYLENVFMCYIICHFLFFSLSSFSCFPGLGWVFDLYCTKIRWAKHLISSFDKHLA